MTAYLIANVHEITDQKTYDEYLGLVGPTIAKFGGKPVVASSNIGIIEGSWDAVRVLVIEFPDRQAVHDWYASDDYEAIKDMRRRSQNVDVIVIDNG